MLLTDAVNQLLSGESDLDDRIVRREVESIVEAIDCVGHDESPGHRAVLRLADVLAEGVSSIKWRNLRIIFQQFRARITGPTKEKKRRSL